MKTRKNNRRIGTFTGLSVFAICCVYPIIWLFLNSFKDNKELFFNPWGLPKSFQISNYIRAITKGNIGQSFINSAIITIIAVVVAVLLGAMVSYGVARLRFKASGFVKSLFLVGMSIPAYAAIVPLFSIFNSLKLLDSYSSVIIAQIVFAFPITVFILEGFFSTLPSELEEAAIMDGCSILGGYFRIIMPIAKPSIVTVAVIDFINIWNDLLFPQILLSSQNKMPLTVALTVFADLDSVDYSGMLAAVVLTIVPTVLVYIVLHDKIMEGMTAGAVKG